MLANNEDPDQTPALFAYVPKMGRWALYGLSLSICSKIFVSFCLMYIPKKMLFNSYCPAYFVLKAYRSKRDIFVKRSIFNLVKRSKEPTDQSFPYINA